MSQFFNFTRTGNHVLIPTTSNVATNTSTSRKSLHSSKISKVRIVNNSISTANVLFFLNNSKLNNITRTVNGAVSSSTAVEFDENNTISPTNKIRVGDEIRTSDSGSVVATVVSFNPTNSKMISFSPSNSFSDGVTLYFKPPSFTIIALTLMPAATSFVLEHPFSYNKLTHEFLVSIAGENTNITVIID